MTGLSNLDRWSGPWSRPTRQEGGPEGGPTLKGTTIGPGPAWEAGPPSPKTAAEPPIGAENAGGRQPGTGDPQALHAPPTRGPLPVPVSEALDDSEAPPPAVSRPLDAESVGWRSQRTRRENANGCAWLRATAATDSGTGIQARERK